MTDNDNLTAAVAMSLERLRLNHALALAVAGGSAAVDGAGRVVPEYDELTNAQVWDATRLRSMLARTEASVVAVDPWVSGVAAFTDGGSNQAGDRFGTLGQIDGFRSALLEVRRHLARMVEEAERRDAILDAATRVAGGLIGEQILLEASSSAEFAARAQWYASADLGVLAASGLGTAHPYLGVNLYSRAINKDAPLHGPDLRRRVSLVFGLTLTGVARDGRRDNLFGTSAGLLGGGVRVLESIRLGGGALFFRMQDPARTTPDLSLGRAWYMSASVDWDARKILGGLVKLLPNAPQD